MQTPLFQRVAIVGVGLMGASLGMALRRRGLAASVSGMARRESTVRTAVELGAADEGSTDLEAGVRGADLVVVSTPVASIPALVRACAGLLAPTGLLTDLGSVKSPICRECGHLRRPAFVGGHPMCGSEESGPSAAREDLYEGATWVFTPCGSGAEAALARLAELAQAVGARPVVMDPEAHDAAVAASSHLPHLAACALSAVVAGAAARQPAVRDLCAGGFRDTTRVADSSAEIWRDILLANREALDRQLGALEAEVRRWRELLAGGSADRVGAALEEAAAARRALLTDDPPD